MDIQLEQLTHATFGMARQIDRDDIPTSFVDSIDTILETTDYGFRHGCLGHTFAIKANGACVGILLLGEAFHWDTDPPEMSAQPFYRLMGFVIDRRYRNQGIGGRALEEAIKAVYRDFGVRPIALGCHRDNQAAARFYLRHGFRRTQYRESEDYYFLRYPEGTNGAALPSPAQT